MPSRSGAPARGPVGDSVVIEHSSARGASAWQMRVLYTTVEDVKRFDKRLRDVKRWVGTAFGQANVAAETDDRHCCTSSDIRMSPYATTRATTRTAPPGRRTPHLLWVLRRRRLNHHERGGSAPGRGEAQGARHLGGVPEVRTGPVPPGLDRQPEPVISSSTRRRGRPPPAPTRRTTTRALARAR
jgi:hypothetical protein